MVRSYSHDVRNIEHCMLPVFSKPSCAGQPRVPGVDRDQVAGSPGPTTARRATEPLYQEAQAGEVHQMM